MKQSNIFKVEAINPTEKLTYLIYEFLKNSTNGLVPEEPRKISIFMNFR
jgi:hypothetical protein